MGRVIRRPVPRWILLRDANSAIHLRRIWLNWAFGSRKRNDTERLKTTKQVNAQTIEPTWPGVPSRLVNERISTRGSRVPNKNGMRTTLGDQWSAPTARAIGGIFV